MNIDVLIGFVVGMVPGALQFLAARDGKRVDRQTKFYDHLLQRVGQLEVELDKARAEREASRAEVERLRRQLEEKSVDPRPRLRAVSS